MTFARAAVGCLIAASLGSACGEGAGSTEVGTEVCTSGEQWTGGESESPFMHPGMDCINCHSSGEGPGFVVAGTIYPSVHESDDCFGTVGVSVVVTGADGREFSTVSNLSGNFYLSSRSANLVMPFTAKIIANGVEKAMITPQSTGNCASCHSSAGANGSPGRIFAP